MSSSLLDSSRSSRFLNWAINQRQMETAIVVTEITVPKLIGWSANILLDASAKPVAAPIRIGGINLVI